MYIYIYISLLGYLFLYLLLHIHFLCVYVTFIISGGLEAQALGSLVVPIVPLATNAPCLIRQAATEFGRQRILPSQGFRV